MKFRYIHYKSNDPEPHFGEQEVRKPKPDYTGIEKRDFAQMLPLPIKFTHVAHSHNIAKLIIGSMGNTYDTLSKAKNAEYDICHYCIGSSTR